MTSVAGAVRRLLRIGMAACVLASQGSASARSLVLEVPLSDPEMRAATARARAELPHFLERLAAPSPDEGEFMVAYDIIPGNGEELIWVDQLRRSPGLLNGILRSQPQRARADAFDKVTVTDRQIVDWAYRKGATMQGGYTYRVLIGRMPRDESFFLREYLGWQ